jgi:SAM-dependent methyltransferase
MTTPADLRRSSPAALRNREPILGVLGDALPPTGLVLEIASGSGEHVLHFADALTSLDWQPSDPSPETLGSIEAWRGDRANIRPAIAIDAAAADWTIDAADAVVAINMVHISPWAATLGLIAGAARILPAGGLLYLYGPYRRAGHPFAASNAAFDRNLRDRNPGWGIRELADVEAAAVAGGFRLERIVEMPANNLSLLFRRR